MSREPLPAAEAPLLPPAPSGVTPELIAPSAAYKRSAWIATAGLLLFVAVYLGLTAYFGWASYRLVTGARLFPGVLLAIPSMFFFAFLVRGLFVVKHADDPTSVEIFEADQPRLFAFLHQLADDTGAPRPHRVFLSARVNACVFYDLSFLNLVLPSKKNLEIGLGLLNVLSLDELKAVVAHEFGHFAQRTMAVGRWVYVAQQIAGHIVVARTGFDGLLTAISNIDLRVAWIGWIMRLLVWAVRAVLDTVLRVVILAQRALSRHMELQADRVAVSVSGSDSLIHALHRLGPADDAWGEALDFVFEEYGAGRIVTDLFDIQSAALEHHRRIFDEPKLGCTPEVPSDARHAHRVFDTEIASPPRMWATHPPNREREDNAKAIYFASTLDARSGWTLLAAEDAVRAQVTKSFVAGVRKGAPQKQGTTLTREEALERFETRFLRPSLDPRYRGAYLGRPIAAFHRAHGSMIAPRTSTTRETILEAFAGLYPEGIRELVTMRRERREEESLLDGLARGALSAPGGVIRHRGDEIKRGRLPHVIAAVREERKGIEHRLVEHDVLCRSAHRDAASMLGGGWEPYLESLSALLHFATHSARCVQDAHGYLIHVLNIVLADGSVSDAERRRLVNAAGDLHRQLQETWTRVSELSLPESVRTRFDARDGFTVLKEPLKLGAPALTNIGDWLEVVDGWAGGASGDLVVLAEATLDELLAAEEQVARAFSDGTELGAAPSPAKVPTKYTTCTVGSERERQKRLDLWDRFQTADGFFPGLARFVVASAMLLPALLLSGSVGTSTLHAYNGLGIPVVVFVGNRSQGVPPHSHVTFEPEEGEPAHIVVETEDGEVIETFDAPSSDAFGTYVYNVARAGVFVRWTAIYGTGTPPPDHVLTDRWHEADEDCVLTRPPTSVSSRGSSQRTVLEAMGSDAPVALVEEADSESDVLATVSAHLRWEPRGSNALLEWATFASETPHLRAALLARAAVDPSDVQLQRLAMDAEDEAGRAQLCAGYRTRAEATPSDADAAYLAIRCGEDSAERNAAYERAFAEHPRSGVLAYAVGVGRLDQARLADALAAFELAYERLPQGPMRTALLLHAIRAERLAHFRGVSIASAPWEQRAEAMRGMLATTLRIQAGRSEETDSPSVQGYIHLQGGALGAIDELPQPLEPNLRVLAGASEGASDALRARALEADATELGEPALYALLALRVRERRDVAAVLAALRARDTDEATLTELDAVAGAAPEAFAARVKVLAETAPLLAREYLLMMQIVLLGDAVETAVRDEARVGLFVMERPYFR